MRMRLGNSIGILAAPLVWILASVAPAQGQVPWDAPFLVSPDTPAGWGVYLVDPGAGSGLGFTTTWRGGGPVGYRIGLAEEVGDDLSVYGGFDYSGTLVTADQSFPFNLDWVTGAGFGAGDDFVLSFPLGISAGRSIQAESVVFNPYVSPRLILDAILGRDGNDGPGNGPGNDEDDLMLNFAVDLGIDISFDPGWAVRFGAAIGDREALAIGISFRVF